MTWSGDQDANGYELKNYRDEQLDAKPAYTPVDDNGRTIWLTAAAGADEGPWRGSDTAGDWVRPGSFGGGSGGGYAEPGLLMACEPRTLAEFDVGFIPFDPANFLLGRELTAFEALFIEMMYDEDPFGIQEWVPGQAAAPPVPVGGGTNVMLEVFFDSVDGIVWFRPEKEAMANVIVYDIDTETIMDVLTIQVDGPIL